MHRATGHRQAWPGARPSAPWCQAQRLVQGKHPRGLDIRRNDLPRSHQDSSEQNQGDDKARNEFEREGSLTPGNQQSAGKWSR